MSFKLNELVAGESVLVDRDGGRRLFLGMSKYEPDKFITENLDGGTIHKWDKNNTIFDSKLEQPDKKLYAVEDNDGEIRLFYIEEKADEFSKTNGYKRAPEYDIEIKG